MTADLLRLRPYQAKALDTICERIPYQNDTGPRRIAVVLPTGAGKTVLFAHLAKRWREEEAALAGLPHRVLILVHRDELVTQAVDKLRQVAPGVPVGVVKAERNDVDHDVIVASVQTLSRESRRKQLPSVGLTIVDECFPAGTKVGGRSIESIRPGDVVPSWNEDTGREEARPVLRVMRKRPSSLVRVKLDDMTSFVCTPNHPVLTSMGWCPAGMLSRGALLVSFTHDATSSSYVQQLRRTRGSYGVGPNVELQETGPGVLFGRMPSTEGARDGREADSHRGRVHGVRIPDDHYGPEQEDHLQADGPGVLFGRLPGCVGVPGFIPAHGPDEPEARVRADDAEQPHAPAGESSEDVSDAAVDGAQAPDTGRQRSRDYGSAAGPGRPSGLADGSDDHAVRRPNAVALQSGYRPSDDEGLRGSGRGIPLLAGSPRVRPEAGRASRPVGVDSVQVLKPGRDGTYGGVCPDGYVYNLEVDTTHTYLIENGVVVHNCHHASASGYRSVLEHVGAYDRRAVAVGFTATMARGDGQGLGDVWQEVVFRLDILDLIEQGHLVDVAGRRVTIDGLTLENVMRRGGDFAPTSLSEALMSADAMRVTVDAYERYAKDRSGIVFTPNVESAHAFAAEFNDRGIEARPVYGAMNPGVRRMVLEAFKQGKIQVLVNCAVLTEGFDAPIASCCVIARPTLSAALYCQMAGRVLRPYPGKTDALVLDVAGASEMHQLATLADLSTRRLEVVNDGESLTEAVRREREAGNPALADYVVDSYEVDLFRRSEALWLQTHQGVWFTSTRDSLYFLWPGSEPDLYKAGKRPIRGAGGGWIAEDVDFGTAQGWCEQEALADDAANKADGGPSLALKNASWRKGRQPASPGQLSRLERMGLEAPAGVTKRQASDLISVELASRALDKAISGRK